MKERSTVIILKLTKYLISLKETGKTRDSEAEYSEVYQDAASFFIQASGFWDLGENPEISYLKARKEMLPLPDQAKISSIEIDLESCAAN